MNNTPKVETIEDISTTEPTFNQMILMKQTEGSLYLNLNLPTTVPTGSPRNLSEQRQFVLVEGAPVNATAFVAGTIYKISTVGTTDFTLVGAPNSDLNTFFTATGAGTGTGQGVAYTVREYVYIPQLKVWKYITLT